MLTFLSALQTVVLMLFNDAQKLSFQDIKDATGIEDKELRRTLQSLACGKVRVLQKVGAYCWSSSLVSWSDKILYTFGSSFFFLCDNFLKKKKILQLPKGRDVEDDDSFVFNEGFTAPLYRIKVWASVMQQYCDTFYTRLFDLPPRCNLTVVFLWYAGKCYTDEGNSGRKH